VTRADQVYARQIHGGENLLMGTSIHVVQQVIAKLPFLDYSRDQNSVEHQAHAMRNRAAIFIHL